MTTFGAIAPHSPSLTPADGRALIPPGGAAGRPQVEGRLAGPFDERDRVYELRRSAAELRRFAQLLDEQAWGLDRELRRARRRR